MGLILVILVIITFMTINLAINKIQIRLTELKFFFC